MGADNYEKRKKQKGPRYLQLFHFMLQSAAWHSLSPVARCVYQEIASRYMGSNNGRIPYSVREGAKELRVGKTTIQRALDDLVDHGFIVVTKLGAFSVKLKHATEWRLTEHSCDVTHQPATKDFMRWTPKIQKPVPVAGLSVPVAGPIGTCGRTDVADMSRNGTCGGTVEAQNPKSQSRGRYTYSLPGSAEPSSASAPPLSASPYLVAEIKRQDARARRTPKGASENAFKTGGGAKSQGDSFRYLGLGGRCPRGTKGSGD